MSAQSPDLSSTADTVPGRRSALTSSPSQAVPATDTPGGALAGLVLTVAVATDSVSAALW